MEGKKTYDDFDGLTTESSVVFDYQSDGAWSLMFGISDGYKAVMSWELYTIGPNIPASEFQSFLTLIYSVTLLV